MYPGDPHAPASEVINCRCYMRKVAPASAKSLNVQGESGIIKERSERYANASFLNDRLLSHHYGKHRQEYPDLTEEKYVKLGRELLMSEVKSGNVEEISRSDGSVSRYDFANNLFVATTPDGHFRTIFWPKDKEEYWKDEHKRNE